MDFGDNHHALYSASKLAMKLMSEAMRREVKAKSANVKITVSSRISVLTPRIHE